MRKRLTVYSCLLTLMFITSSCLGSDDDIVTHPYVSLRSFSLGDMRSYHAIVNESGRDTTIVKVVPGRLYPFSIDQNTFQVTNKDSLPMGTKITRVVSTITSDGVPYVYVDSLEEYRLFSSKDSIDYTLPVKFLILSTSGKYNREYTVKVNVSKTDPNELYWKSLEANPAKEYSGLKLFVTEDSLYLLGRTKTGELQTTKTHIGNANNWSVPFSIAGLPISADISNTRMLGDKLFVAAGGSLYVSHNMGRTWDESQFSGRFDNIILASNADNKLWASINNTIAYGNGVDEFTITEPMPTGFPVLDISSFSYPLKTNNSIFRYMVIGRNSDVGNTQPQVWSKLSTEVLWSHYTPSDYNTNVCPNIENLKIFPYDGKFFAIGGKGKVEDVEVEAFSAIYTSLDNGLTWMSADEEYDLPESLLGNNSVFTVETDEKQYIWLIVSGDNGGIWRGRINRLSAPN